MTTYSTLRDRALGRVDCVGQSEAQTIAQNALEEAMKFVAFHVRVPSLIASASATAPANASLEANAIAIESTGFAITSGVFQAPDRLFVKADSTVVGYGTPYDFLEYHHFLDLKSVPGGSRIDLFTPALVDERPRYAYTITPTSKIWTEPLTEGNVLTLFYRKVPAAYSGAATPEILPAFDYILVNGAELALKEWLREPTEIITLWDLFKAHLMPEIELYDDYIHSQRKRTYFKIHRSYRVTK